MIENYTRRDLSPLCRKKPPRRFNAECAPYLSPKPILIFAILAIMALGGGMFLETNSKKNTQGSIAAELPEPLFRLKLLIDAEDYPTGDVAQIIKENLEQIGIESDIDAFAFPRYSFKSMVEDSTGQNLPRGILPSGTQFNYSFDLALASRPPDILGEWSLSDYYHSPPDISNEYPIDTSGLDELLDAMKNSTDLLQKRQLLSQVLGQIVWDIQAVTGVCDLSDLFALDADIRNFDPDRWALGVPNLPEMYFESTNPTIFAYAVFSEPIEDHNPVFWYGFTGQPQISPYLPGNGLANLVYSRTFEQDKNLTLRPILALDFPVAIGSNDLVPTAGITPDSPYFGKGGTSWGPNPAINSSRYNANVKAEDNSMFLVRLRDGIPWQPGYGYTAEMKLNVTADDLVWTLSYLLNDELRSHNLEYCHAFFGTEFSKAIEKINETTVKINLHGALGDGRVANWLDALAIAPFPRHILDPTFDATLYGGKVGETPNGTVIPPYGLRQRFPYKPPVSCGPYYLEDFSSGPEQWYKDPGVQARVTLRKFDEWRGRGANSLWNDPQFMHNNIETYKYENYGDWDEVKLRLLYYDLLDGVDWGWRAVYDFPHDISAWVDNPKIQIPQVSSPRQKILIFNVLNSHLSNLYVRLAISHVIPRQEFVNTIHRGNGIINELVGVTHQLDDYPKEEEWELIAPSSPVNITNQQLGGHITYDLEKAWALMELAGYDMTPYREAFSERGGEQTKTDAIPLPIFPVILAIAVSAAFRFLGKSRKYDRE